jgi:pimeloyl-ACP methyl ester carboxylesterase
VLHRKVLIASDKFQIKADLKIPGVNCGKTGIILSHGIVINRKSLSRDSCSLAEYLCRKLNTYVITPDYLGETVHKESITFDSLSEVLSESIDFLYEDYGVEEVMGFGHSMGCYVLLNTLEKNNRIKSIVNYGGPTNHALKQRQFNLVVYMIQYFSKFDYTLDFKNLIKYLFDEETKNYFHEIMLNEEEFGSENYNFKIDTGILRGGLEILDKYIYTIKKWGKPALLLFGSEDLITQSVIKHLPDGYIDENVLVKHIQGGSHITPCMATIFNLEKLDPVIKFFELIHRDPNYPCISYNPAIIHSNL